MRLLLLSSAPPCFTSILNERSELRGAERRRERAHK
nr:MAG TPA: hypothetical protein [Caudoviricetes sp.]